MRGHKRTPEKSCETDDIGPWVHLRPCPFCGGEAYAFQMDAPSGYVLVGCMTKRCYGKLTMRDGELYAEIRRWNRRVNE